STAWGPADQSRTRDSMGWEVKGGKVKKEADIFRPLSSVLRKLVSHIFDGPDSLTGVPVVSAHLE
ncbi:hypothetical protein ACLOJK_039825, partial [Asimina triloba]